jgi:hypothetical protein
MARAAAEARALPEVELPPAPPTEQDAQRLASILRMLSVFPADHRARWSLEQEAIALCRRGVVPAPDPIPARVTPAPAPGHRDGGDPQA